MNMLSRKVCAFVAFCLSIFFSHSALASFPSVILEDSFEGGAVNLTNWIVSLPFSDSSVVPNDGSVTLNNNGQIAATTTLNAPYTIVLEDVSMSSWEVLSVTIRSDGLIPPGQEVAPGIRFNFWNHAGHAGAWFYPAGIDGGEALSSGTFAKSSTYKIKITDDGYNFMLWVNDALIFSGESSLSAGNKITIFNRGTQRGWAIPSSTTIGSVRITQDGPTDSDGDGVNDYREEQDGTDSNNAASFNPLSKKLVAYFPFNGNAQDESGYGNAGTQDNVSFVDGFDGKAESAAFFNGAAGVSVPESDSLRLSSRFTFSTWVRVLSWDGYGGNNGHPLISAGGAPHLSEQAFGVGLTEWSSDFMFAGINDYPVNSVISFSRSYSPLADLSNVANEFPAIKLDINPGQWRLLTFTYDGTTARSYLDGQLLQSFTYSNAINISPYTGWVTLRLGFNHGGERLLGTLDDVRIYDRALSTAEVGQLYQAEAGNLDSDGDGLSDAWERGYGRYQVVQGTKTWDQAKADAEARGGHMATITSRSEQEIIVSFFEPELREGRAGTWIGAYQTSKTDEPSGNWAWVNGEQWSFVNWNVAPDNHQGDQDYGYIIGDIPGFSKWDDAPLAGRYTHYLLEFGYPTDPFNADSDGDGFNDSIETHYQTDPNNASVTPNNSRPTGAVSQWFDQGEDQSPVPNDLTETIQIAAGYAGYALKADGTVAAWGEIWSGNGSGNIPAYIPEGLSNIVQIDAGLNYALALSGDGALVTWGHFWSGYGHQAAFVPDSLSGVVQISAGISHAAALKADGTIAVWGTNNWGQTDVPAGLSDVVQVQAGGYHTMALKRDGTVVVWGGIHSQVRDIPAGLSDVVKIAAGGHVCVALKRDGTLVAWGSDNLGGTDVPVGLTDVVAISASPHVATIAVKQDGTAVSWGDKGNLPAVSTSILAADAGWGRNIVLSAEPADTDNDGIPDNYETNTGTWVSSTDTGTNPGNPDTDGDGLLDGVETNTGMYVSPDDTGTNPNLADTDGDGLGDGVETASYIYIDATDTGTDPNIADSDGDGLKDGAETNTGVFGGPSDTGTNPLEADTSGDGLLDGDVVAAGYNPNTSYTGLFNLVKAKGVATQEGIGLFPESAMMDLNLGGVTLRRSGGTVNLRLQIQSKLNLNDPHWRNEGTETFILEMPGNKAFMRIRALGPQ